MKLFTNLFSRFQKPVDSIVSTEELSEERYFPMREIIETNLNGPIVDAPGTESLGSGGPMRGSILRGQAKRVLREKGYSAGEVAVAMFRYDLEKQNKRKSA